MTWANAALAKNTDRFQWIFAAKSHSAFGSEDSQADPCAALAAETQAANESSILSRTIFINGKPESPVVAATLLKQHLVKKSTDAWRLRLQNPSLPLTSTALSETVQALFETMAQYGIERVFLDDLEPKYVNGLHLAVVLRATFSHKDDVAGWSHALEVARAALEMTEMIPEEELDGLY